MVDQFVDQTDLGRPRRMSDLREARNATVLKGWQPAALAARRASAVRRLWRRSRTSQVHRPGKRVAIAWPWLLISSDA